MVSKKTKIKKYSQPAEGHSLFPALRSDMTVSTHSYRSLHLEIKQKPKTITEYINMMPKNARAKLRQMRATVKASAPRAMEGLRWNMPSISYHRILVMYGGFKHHIGLYPTARVVEAFTKELSKYKKARGSVQFRLDKPLPVGLIKRMVAFRVRESIKKDGTWRS